MSLDFALSAAYMVTEAVVICLLAYRRVWRLIPFFFIYCIWDLLINISLNVVQIRLPHAYFNFYLIETGVDSLLQFCVLVDLAWSVLRPIRASLPRAALVVVAGLILAVGAAIWPFSDLHSQLSPEGHLLMHILQTVAILRVVFFLLLAGGSQLLSIGWRDRELQVATGLGFYSLVSLGVAMVHTHSGNSGQFTYWNEFVVASYVLSLVYWVFSFAHKQAERREFTPQMQNLLLAMAGVARADREALAQRMRGSKDDRR